MKKEGFSMKHMIKLSWIIALVVVIGFLMIACNNLTDPSDDQPDLIGIVTINNNSPNVGDTLTAAYSGGNGSGTATWQWLRNGTPIPSTNNDTYTVTIADANKRLNAQVSFSNQKGSVISVATSNVSNDIRMVLTGIVTINNNSPNVGDTLTAAYSGGNGSGTATWQWLRDDTPISSTDDINYTVTSDDVDKTLKVQVNFANQRGSAVSSATDVVTAILTGSVTIDNNSPNLGDTLTAVYSDGNGSGTATWQWLWDNILISGASDINYTVTSDDVSKRLKAQVSFNNLSGNVISSATDVVTAILTGTVTINNNSPNPGDTITAVYSDGNGSGTATWQWLWDNIPISGASDINYTVTSDDVDKTLKVQVTFNNQSGSITSAATAVVPRFYWTKANYGSSDLISVSSIIWGKDKFVAVGSPGRMAYSADGITWTLIPETTFRKDNFYANAIYDITFGGSVSNEKFIVVGYSHVAYSVDGLDWHILNTPTISADSAQPTMSIVWGGPSGQEKFVAGGVLGMLAYSTNGMNFSWNIVSFRPFSSSQIRIYDIVWGRDKFVAVGSEGKMAYSADGVTWTEVMNTAFGNSLSDSILGIAWGGPSGQEKFVAVGYRGGMAYSVDGITWTAIGNTIFGSSDIGAIAWGEDRFVAAGANGKMAYSADGVTWTALENDLLKDRTINAIIWGGPSGQERFIAGDTYGNIFYSSDFK